jgi:hypothetical protein
MNNYILLSLYIAAIIIINSNSLLTQDYESPALRFTYKIGSTTYTNEPFMQSRFQQNSFIISTQWYGHPKILQALKFNAQQGCQPYGGLVVIPNPNPNYKMYHIWDNRAFEFGRGFQYEPTITINDNNPDSLIKRQGDTTHSIFGFRLINYFNIF